VAQPAGLLQPQQAWLLRMGLLGVVTLLLLLRLVWGVQGLACAAAQGMTAGAAAQAGRR
jgi:hypothetical protein